MSLQVWLPLTGDLCNQGLSNLNTINMPTCATIDNTGKIGKCYTSDGTADGVVTNFNFQASEFSIAAWVRINTRVNSWRCPLKLVNSSSAENYQYIGFCCEHNNQTSTIGFHFYKTINGTNTAIFDSYAITNMPVGEWVHLAVTYNGTIASCYKNGIKVSSVSIASANQNTIANIDRMVILGSNGSRGVAPVKSSLNDVRIYDHALSDKEVEEIAKGLVLHYKLDNITQPNLLSNNPNLVNAWVQDGITLTQENDNSLKCVVTNNSNKRIYNNVSNVWTTIGNTYTVSFLAKAQTNGTEVRASRSIADYAPTFTLTTNWKYYSAQITITATSTSGTLSIQGINNGDVFWLRNIKLENGNIATHYLLPNDIINNVYDSSGYGYNGITIGVPALDINTARYNESLKFTTNTDSITITPYLANGQTLNEITVSCWFKTNTLNSTAPNIFSLGENSFLRCRLANATSIQSYYRLVSTQVSDTYSCKTLTDDNWHMLSFVFDNGIEYVYIDGIQIGTTNRTSNGTYLTCASLNWHLAGYSANSENFIGNLSDFRIYATALTIDQILELYHTSATIDNNGNIYARELVEE